MLEINVNQAEAITAKQIGEKFPQFYIRKREILSHSRGQGKRCKGQVMGGMATVGLVITYNYDMFNDLPNITEENKRELFCLEIHERTYYMQGRYIGFDHDDAMRYVYLKNGEFTLDQWKNLVKE
jgi:hypothetical protein